MYDEKTVELKVRLPRDIAEQAKQLAREDPKFLSRVILYGITRRSIYRHLRAADGAPEKNAKGEPLTEHERRVLSENPQYHPGGAF